MSRQTHAKPAILNYEPNPPPDANPVSKLIILPPLFQREKKGVCTCQGPK